MKFKKTKKPPTIQMNTGEFSIDSAACAVIKISYTSTAVGPREAVRLAKWLLRYAKWSSLENRK